jgi:hypothetical protein
VPERIIKSSLTENCSPVRVTIPGNREVRVDTPGRYSVSTDGGTTRFLVRAGEGAVADEDGSPIAVHAGGGSQAIRIGAGGR